MTSLTIEKLCYSSEINKSSQFQYKYTICREQITYPQPKLPKSYYIFHYQMFLGKIICIISQYNLSTLSVLNTNSQQQISIFFKRTVKLQLEVGDQAHIPLTLINLTEFLNLVNIHENMRLDVKRRRRIASSPTSCNVQITLVLMDCTNSDHFHCT